MSLRRAPPEQDENPASVERAKEAFPFAHQVEQIANLGRESYVSWVPAWKGMPGWQDVRSAGTLRPATGMRHAVLATCNLIFHKV